MKHSKPTKAIISLDIMPRDVYDKFSKLSHLQNKTPDEVWKAYPMTGKGFNPNTQVKETSIIEPYLLLSYLKERNITPRFWYNNPLFIYNEKLFRIVGADIVEVDLEGLYYISFRESFAHPFYRFLKILLKQNGGKLAKPNMQTMDNVGCMNKLYGIEELYSHRVEFLGDFIMPYNLTDRDFPVFMEFVRKHLGDKVVFKQDCVQEGKGVIFKDLSKPDQLESITKILRAHKIRSREVFISPAYEIAQEYRCYFTKYGDKKRIFSIKQRVNSDEIDVYEKENIAIYENISVKWHEVRTDSKVFSDGVEIAKKMLKHMSYDTGCLEFAQTPDGKIIFFEVNQMAGPLPFEGEDCENMTRYYHSIFSKMLSMEDE